MALKFGGRILLSGLMLFVCSIFLTIPKADAAVGDIFTVGGTGGTVAAADGTLAAVSGFNAPDGIIADASGSIIVADTLNNMIRKIDSTGKVTTVAGTGYAGFSGDGGPATAAQLNSPAGIYIDGAGSIYFADRNNNRIRKITTAGTISTVAGNGASKFGGDGKPAIRASLKLPEGVTFDTSGNMYVADTGNSRIRKVNTLGTISTFAGTGTAGYSGDGGLAAKAMLNKPRGIGFDTLGNLYIADTNNNRVRVINAAGIIQTAAGNGVAAYLGDGGPAISASLNKPASVLFANGLLTIADTSNSAVRTVDGNGIINTLAGTGTAGFSGDFGPATAALLNNPVGVGTDTKGNIFISDSMNNRVRMVQGSSYTLPVSEITAPSNGASLAGSISVAGAASGADGVAYVEVSTDCGATWFTASGTSSWSYSWTPSVSGTFYILSRATDTYGNKGDIMGCVLISASASVTPITINSLTPSVPSPVMAGASVTWTASASNGSGSYQYQFSRMGPDTGGTYAVMQTWGSSNTWTWSTTSSMAGTNTIMVSVRNSDGTGTVSNTAPAYTVISGPVGYWKFDETSGTTAVDSSGFGNNGTLNGAVRVTGVSGNAVYFDGSGTNVSVPGTSLLEPSSTVSVMAWVNTSKVSGTGGEDVVSMGDSYALRVLPDGEVSFIYYNGSSWINAQGSYVLDGKWHHMAGVKSASQLEVFVDGVLQATASTTGSIAYTLGTNLIIGKNGNGSTNFNFTGTADEVRVYNRDLSATEVQAIYASITPPAPSPIVINSLSANPVSPSNAGTTVTWTASASGGSGSLLYQFLRQGPDTGGAYVLMQDYSASNTCSWLTTSAMAGTNTIVVNVANSDKSGVVSMSSTYAVAQVVTTTLTSIVISSLNPSLSAASVNQSVTWTASATGGSGSYLYQFMRKGPDTSGNFVLVQGWSSSNTWTFAPTSAMVGTNYIMVNVENSDGTGAVSLTSPAYNVSSGAVYYMDSVNGNDSNNGLSPSTAWQTISKLNATSFSAGTQILFNRGQTWRIPNAQFAPKSSGTSGSPIVVGAYGTGARPKVLQSVNKSSSSNWTNESGNLWYTSMPYYVGNIIFNNEAFCGTWKSSKTALTAQGYYWNDHTNQRLYLYSVGNPGTVYSVIECAEQAAGQAMIPLSVSGWTFQDLDFRYAGDSVFNLFNANYITVQRCNMSYVGGGDNGSGTRYGNGFNIWDSGHDITVRYCTIDNCYDTGISPQGLDSGSAYNLYFYYNLITNCNYGFEFWERGASFSYSNVYFENNTVAYAGNGWYSNQRPDGNSGRCVIFFNSAAAMSNVYIRNNIFYQAWLADFWIDPAFANISGVTIDYNTYYNSEQPTSPNDWLIYYMGTWYEMSTFSNYKAATGKDAHSQAVNPQFVNGGSTYPGNTASVNPATCNFSLTSTSPAAASGLNGIYPSGTTDILSNPLPTSGNLSDGAYQYQ